jgi:hypothetical protein
MAREQSSKGLSLSRSKAARLAAAKARARGKSSDTKPGLWGRVIIVWKWLASFFNWLKSCALYILGAGIFILIGALLWQTIGRPSIVIAPISVPDSLAKTGYTAEVAAQRLQSALTKIVAQSHSTKAGPNVATQTDLPKITVPITGLSLDALADSFGTFLGWSNRTFVAGDITYANKNLRLHLRANGKDVYLCQRTWRAFGRRK